MTGARVTVATVVLALALASGACRGSRALPNYTVTIGGDADRGRAVIAARHCGACHEIPHVTDAAGVIGPPLGTFWRRSFIGGVLPNTPDNLVRWIRNPHGVDSETAMPTLALDDRQARDIATFLYALQGDF